MSRSFALAFWFSRVHRTVLGLSALALAGCTAAPHPDFSRLYAQRATIAARTPVIVIPGVLGSRLIRPDGREVWPGGIAALLSGRSFRELALPPAAPDAPSTATPLVARGFFDELGGRSFYADLVHALETHGRYRCHAADQIDSTTDCVLMAWDWRLDFVEAAKRLEAVIEKLRAVRFDPELRADIIAHSAGGLVARYYANYGGTDVLASDDLPVPDPGGHGVDRLILIGTPNFGSIAAVQQAMFGKRFPLGRVGAEVLASFPGMAQLFPHPRLDWMIERDGLPAKLDLFSLATWREYRVGIYSTSTGARLRRRLRDDAARRSYLDAVEKYFAKILVRGERFQKALAIPLRTSRVRTYIFGSGCVETPARCLVERERGRLALRRRPEQIRYPIAGVDYRARMLEPGDGSVTKSSLLGLPSLVDGRPGAPLFPIAASVFVCAPHARLASDPTFLDNLLHALLYRDAPSLQPTIDPAATASRIQGTRSGGGAPPKTGPTLRLIDGDQPVLLPTPEGLTTVRKATQ